MVNFNPFLNATTRTLFRKSSFQEFEWFSDKTRGLSGYENESRTQNWRILDILLIVNSMPTPNSPGKLAEFAFVLFLSFVVHFHDLHKSVCKQKKQRLKTIKDVVLSPRESRMNPGAFIWLLNFSEGSSWLFLIKSTINDDGISRLFGYLREE